MPTHSCNYPIISFVLQQHNAYSHADIAQEPQLVKHRERKSVISATLTVKSLLLNPDGLV